MAKSNYYFCQKVGRRSAQEDSVSNGRLVWSFCFLGSQVDVIGLWLGLGQQRAEMWFILCGVFFVTLITYSFSYFNNQTLFLEGGKSVITLILYLQQYGFPDVSSSYSGSNLGWEDVLVLMDGWRYLYDTVQIYS